jgi:hypothetical protein
LASSRERKISEEVPFYGRITTLIIPEWDEGPALYIRATVENVYRYKFGKRSPVAIECGTKEKKFL